MTDPLVGTDTYDILGGLNPQTLPEQLERWGRLDQHELMQMDGWAPMVTLLMRESAKEIVRLRGMAGAVTDGQSFADIRRIAKSTTADGNGC